MKVDLEEIEFPIKCAGQYIMDFYCKYKNSDHEISGEYLNTVTRTRSEAIKTAKAVGWLFHSKDNTATCAKCAKKLRKKR